MEIRKEMAENQNKKAKDQTELPPWTLAQIDAVEKTHGKEQVECLYPVTQVAENAILRNDAWMQTDFRLISFDDSSQDVIRQRLREMTRAHQALRSVFLIPEGERPVQAVLKEKEISFFYEDISDRAGEAGTISAEQKTYISGIVSSDIQSPQDLRRGSLFQVKLFRIKPDRAILYLYYSHALLDGEAVLSLVNELLGRSMITSDREVLNRHFHRVFYDSTTKERQFWENMGIQKGLTSFHAAEAADSSGTSFRSFAVGNEKLLSALKDYCTRSSVIVSAALHYCLGRALCALLGTKSCTFLSVTRGRKPEESKIPGMFAHEYPFVFHEGDTVFDCQAQLVAASKHTWLFCIPGIISGFERNVGAVALDVINMHVPEEIRRESLPFMEVLDEKAMGDHLSNLHSGPEEENLIFIQSPLLLGRLYHGTYCPQHISSPRVKELARRLDTELKNLISRRDERLGRDCKGFKPACATAGDNALRREPPADKHGLKAIKAGACQMSSPLSVISLDGLPILAAGLHSVVYDYDENRILKVFPEANAARKNQIKKEQDCAAQMKRLGVRVAAAGEAVLAECKGDMRFGLFFEKVKGISLGEALLQYPDRLSEYASAAGRFVRELHSVRAGQDLFSDAKSIFAGYVILYRRFGVLSDAQAKILSDMADLVPSRSALLHGDLSFENIMIDGQGMILIDPEQAAVGHPIWDLIVFYRNLFVGPGIGMIKGKWVPSAELAGRFFDSFLMTYFDSTDVERIASTKDVLKTLSCFWLIGTDALGRVGMPLMDNGLSSYYREKLFSSIDTVNEYFTKECNLVFADEGVRNG